MRDAVAWSSGGKRRLGEHGHERGDDLPMGRQRGQRLA